MIRLRPYAPGDRAAVKTVFYRAVHEGAAGHYTAAQRAAWAPDPTVDPAQPDRLVGQFCLLCERDGQITGFMSLCDDGYLDMAFVLPEVRGKGDAAALYDAILAEAQRRALPRLTAHASLLARPFFARRGWRVEQTEDHPVGPLTLRRFAMQILLPAAPGPQV
ncbi:GNAT family N-acetyltransferase [Pseudotabrizicola alkalilacus]|uniref:GNAT family N-acetyltransferase n=1 Tax=Pseudotabrizicola alkalilacus TaxID=2305252 RepID=A0A411Z1L2_9RHOB|nr:GNAT family N-acetyltransferase [Pseudotabrizicola alkalilacus]RGP36956.1 GNAT family N-acetyltransferase [Pseudotabrizicola alkalilacus]